MLKIQIMSLANISGERWHIDITESNETFEWYVSAMGVTQKKVSLQTWNEYPIITSKVIIINGYSVYEDSTLYLLLITAGSVSIYLCDIIKLGLQWLSILFCLG